MHGEVSIGYIKEREKLNGRVRVLLTAIGKFI